MNHQESTVWDFWAGRYEKLWVQKYSLSPTRRQAAGLAMACLDGADAPLRLLDVGCGTGQLCADLAGLLPGQPEEDWQITGLDASPAMLSAAKNKNIPGCRLIPGDAHHLPLKSSRFHLVSCCHSLPYYRDQAQAIREMVRVLRPGGTLLLAQAAEDNPYDALVLAGVKLTTGRAVYPSSRQVYGLLQGAGLVDIRQQRLQTAVWMPSIVMSIGRRWAT